MVRLKSSHLPAPLCSHGSHPLASCVLSQTRVFLKVNSWGSPLIRRNLWPKLWPNQWQPFSSTPHLALTSMVYDPLAISFCLDRTRAAEVSLVGPLCSHLQIWELDHKEGWAPKHWCFQTMVLGKILESPLDCRKIEAINPKGNQPWIFIERTDAEAETPILWPPDGKSLLTGKDPDAGKEKKIKRKSRR